MNKDFIIIDESSDINEIANNIILALALAVVATPFVGAFVTKKIEQISYNNGEYMAIFDCDEKNKTIQRLGLEDKKYIAIPKTEIEDMIAFLNANKDLITTDSDVKYDIEFNSNTEDIIFKDINLETAATLIDEFENKGKIKTKI